LEVGVTACGTDSRPRCLLFFSVLVVSYFFRGPALGVVLAVD
jgi:hypothetical protein